MSRRLILACLIALLGFGEAHGLSFALDSIAQWGRFPKFCIDVYRWGDGFFNGYDTLYVQGTGYKFNGRAKADSWFNKYTFYLPDNVRMSMETDASTTIGAQLTYLAVSAGYDKNISRIFGHSDQKNKEQFSFGFSCSLFSFNMDFINYHGGFHINEFGPPGHRFNPNIVFSGINSTYFGFDTYYFFNHKRYSQAAAFGYSRLQKRSQGSWFAGLSFYTQGFDFDFSTLPDFILETLPDDWTSHKYEANTKNFAAKFGYGYNWVFRPNWLLAVSESPTIGIRHGFINNPDKKDNSVSLNNELRASLVWNHKQWFAGLQGSMDAALIYDKNIAFQNAVFSASLQVGYRFNIW